MPTEIKQIKPNIIQFTWWIDTERRIWVIHAIWHKVDIPTTVLLLRFGDNKLTEQPYEVIQGLVQEKVFKQISPIINESISINSNGSGFVATVY